MKRLSLLVLLLVLSATWLQSRNARANQGGFIIERADDVKTVGVIGSTELGDRLDEVLSRFVVQFANEMRQQDIVPAPAGLVNVLGQAQPRYVIEFANENRFVPITHTPATLNTLLQNVVPRFIVQFANGLRTEPLTFPIELIDDNVPPTIDQPNATQQANNSIEISWTTNEFATSEIRYGNSPRVYPWSVSDPLFAKEHNVVLSNLTEGDYYYRIVNTDLSGNVKQSREYSFTVVEQAFIYLPFLKK